MLQSRRRGELIDTGIRYTIKKSRLSSHPSIHTLHDMNPKLLVTLDKVLDDVIDALNESGWEDEAEWYDDLRHAILAAEPGTHQFTELLVELDQSFLGMGSFTDIPLSPQLAQATEELNRQNALDTHQQRLGLASCASGIIYQIKKASR